MGSSVTMRGKNWERITILGHFGLYLKFKGQNLGYLSPIFLEAKFGAPTRISEANFGAKPPDLWAHFAFYSHVQLRSSGNNVIKISKNKDHSQLVMNESGRV